MKRILTSTALVIAASLLMPAQGLGYNWYYSLVKARYALTDRTQSCLVCHARAGSERLNAYGADFQAAGANAGAIAAIAGRDSDGDGIGNDVELRTGHFPGEGADLPDPAKVRKLGVRNPASGDLFREVFESLQCPCCDKLVMSCQCDMVPEIRRIVRDGVTAGRRVPAIKEELVARFGRQILPLRERAETLPADRFAAPRVANAYRIAAAIPGELEKYPCFCPCYRMNGHLSLFDCYKNEHGARCTVCIEEAEIVEAMVLAKKPEAEVRTRLVGQFGGRH